MKYKSRIVSIVVLPIGEPVFSEQATTVSIDDESGGEFVRLSQSRDESKPGSVTIDPDEWPLLRETIDGMFLEIKANENGTE